MTVAPDGRIEPNRNREGSRQTMNKHSVDRWWREYAEKVVPGGGAPFMMRESKRAFYAGAAALFDAIMSGLSDGDEPTAADEEHLIRLEAELTQFAADVKAGRA